MLVIVPPGWYVPDVNLELIEYAVLVVLYVDLLRVQLMFVSWRHNTSASVSRAAWVIACQLSEPFFALMVLTFRDIILNLFLGGSGVSMSLPQYSFPVARCRDVW